MVAPTEPEAQELHEAKLELVEKIWPVIVELGQQQRHFNTIQGHYRTMASTWLLAALGGVGFIYSAETLGAPFGRNLLAGLLAAVSGLGVGLLWMLDVVVYHELLVANYDAAKRLERRYAWLPKVRTGRRKQPGDLTVRERVSLFYLGTMSLLFFVSAIALAHSEEVTASVPSAAVFAGMIIAGAVLVIAMQKYLGNRILQEDPGRLGEDANTEPPAS